MSNRKFRLTRDMVPIQFTQSGQHGATFACPLPRDYESLWAVSDLNTRKSQLQSLAIELGFLARSATYPFENIFFEAGTRSAKFIETELVIRDIHYGEFTGLTGFRIGTNCDSGDAYMTQRGSEWGQLRRINLGFMDSFDPGALFQCHNMDFYWQALLAREFCVRYFNLLVDAY
jgi:hypothetical protein